MRHYFAGLRIKLSNWVTDELLQKLKGSGALRPWSEHRKEVHINFSEYRAELSRLRKSGKLDITINVSHKPVNEIRNKEKPKMIDWLVYVERFF